FGQRGKEASRPQISECAELVSQSEEAGFGTQVGWVIVERGITYRAQQDGIRVEAGLKRVRGKRIVVRTNRAAPCVFRSQIELMTKFACDCFEDLNRLGGYFGPDPVTGQHDDFDFHGIEKKICKDT